MFAMKFHQQKPSSLLAPFIKSYWMIENAMAEGRQHVQRIVPTGLLELSFYLKDRPLVSDNKKQVSEKAVVTGQFKDFFDIRISGRLSLFSIYFYPHGLALFLNIPLKELQNQTIPLRFLVKSLVGEVEEQLAATSSFQERIHIIEGFLLQRLKMQHNRVHHPRVMHSMALINRSKGMLDIDFLAGEACLSRKQFERIFQEYVGISPKQFLRIIRFQNAIYTKSFKKDISLTELAFACGYYDQSHMISDFIKFSGQTPGDYFSQCEPFSDYFQE